MNARNWLTRSGLRRLVAAAGGALVILAALTAHAQAPLSPAKAYVGLFKDNAVAVVDTAAQRVLGTIPVPPGPHGLVLTPDGRKAYVSSDGASTVSVIDTATDRIVTSIEVGPNPHGLAISPDGRTVLVSGLGSNQAVLIDTMEDKVIGRIPVAQPHNSAIAADGRAYVGSQLQGSTAIVVLDLATRAQARRHPARQDAARARREPGRQVALLHPGRIERRAGARHGLAAARGGDPGGCLTPSRALHAGRADRARREPGPRRARDPGRGRAVR